MLRNFHTGTISMDKPPSLMVVSSSLATMKAFSICKNTKSIQYYRIKMEIFVLWHRTNVA